MSDALQPGDLAIVIRSVWGKSVGAIVQCIAIKGTHSEYGTVWTIRAQHELVSEFGGRGYIMDLPATWLRKIRPDDTQHNQSEQRDYENSF